MIPPVASTPLSVRLRSGSGAVSPCSRMLGYDVIAFLRTVVTSQPARGTSPTRRRAPAVKIAPSRSAPQRGHVSCALLDVVPHSAQITESSCIEKFERLMPHPMDSRSIERMSEPNESGRPIIQ